MAELLIKAVDAKNPTPGIDLAGCYKRGDVVIVKPDGWKWGKCEGLPRFIVLKVPSMTIESAEQYIESLTQPEHKECDELKKEYVEGFYCEPFIGVPEVLSETTKKETITAEEVNKKAAVKYFDDAPTIVEYLENEKEMVALTGMVTKVRLSGDVDEVKVRRKYNINIDSLTITNSTAEISNVAPLIACKTYGKGEREWQLKS